MSEFDDGTCTTQGYLLVRKTLAFIVYGHTRCKSLRNPNFQQSGWRNADFCYVTCFVIPYHVLYSIIILILKGEILTWLAMSGLQINIHVLWWHLKKILLYFTMQYNLRSNLAPVSACCCSGLCIWQCFHYHSLEHRQTAASCLRDTTCFTSDVTEKLVNILLDGLVKACDDPMTCVTFGNIFQVKSGMVYSWLTAW